MLSWESFSDTGNMDEALRSFLGSQSTGGSHYAIRLSREPGFFDALSVEGENVDVFGVIDEKSIAALAVRTEKKVFVQGQSEAQILGYLGSLRIKEEYQGSLLLQRGYRYLKELHQKGNARAYLTTILSSNAKARHILTSGRGAIPEYKHLGRLHTFFIPPRRRNAYLPSETRIIRGIEVTDSLLEEFLERCRECRNFFPAYTPETFQGGGLLEGFQREDLYLACYRGRIVASLGIWNQRSFRQWHLESPYLQSRVGRIFFNLSRSYHGLPAYQGKDVPLSLWYGVMPIGLPGFENTLLAVLDRVRNDMAIAYPESSLAIGLHERDPQCAVFKRVCKARLDSELYLVSWPEDEDLHIDNQSIPYLEVGGL